ncbi:MAG TPA: hypothetical protein VK404_12000 [Spirosoma sp.]|nr:hypothetical protein [Spirosoma sp.]
MMYTPIRFYNPQGSDETASNHSDNNTPANDKLATETPEGDWRSESDKTTAGHLTNTKLDAKSEGGDQANVRGGDSTILGAGGAGGQSGKGEQTDESDAIQIGLDD